MHAYACFIHKLADPGFPVGGRGPRRGAWTPEARQLRFKNFVCRNKTIWTLRGGRAPGTPPSRSANTFLLHVDWVEYVVRHISEDGTRTMLIIGAHPVPRVHLPCSGNRYVPCVRIKFTSQSVTFYDNTVV